MTLDGLHSTHRLPRFSWGVTRRYVVSERFSCVVPAMHQDLRERTTSIIPGTLVPGLVAFSFTSVLQIRRRADRRQSPGRTGRCAAVTKVE